ncbi:MAG: GerMN domain-containing protein [Tissierellia bacterium]|nr:GerMN domain-containing protein [Tissierellia bacterium]
MKKFTPLLLVALLGLTACDQAAAGVAPDNGNQETENIKVVESQDNGANLQEQENENNGENTPEDPALEEEDAQVPEAEEFEAILYFPSTDYLLGVTEDEKTVTEEVTLQGDKAQGVLDALAEGPQGEDAETTGLENYDYTAELDGDTARVDFTGEISGSSTEEEVLLRAVVNSLLSVDGIKAVVITIDGEEAETLMGHMLIDEPFVNLL